MSGKLGSIGLGQFKLGASPADTEAVIVTGHFNDGTPAGRSAPGTPSATVYRSGQPQQTA